MGYTEKEFDYAVERDKRVISFLHKNPGSIPADKSERDPKLQKRLNAFRRKAEQQRTVKYWTSPEELAGMVEVSVFNLIKDHPAAGWVRGNRNGYADFLQGLNIDRTAIDAFQDGGNAKHLNGIWEAQWYGCDSAGNSIPFLISDPNNPGSEMQYPAEQIEIETKDSVVFCTAQKSFVDLRYWLGGRMSPNSQLSLIYWNEKLPMNGTVFLTLTYKPGFRAKLEGWWHGHNANGEVFRGLTTWVKRTE